jgi:hypothetical protein
MKRWILLIGVLSLCGATGFSQKLVIKNNLLYDLSGTPNIGIEYALAKRWSVSLMAGYNPISFAQSAGLEGQLTSPKPTEVGDGKPKAYRTSLQHWVIQPEVKWWVCEKFYGHYLGLHGVYGSYDVGGVHYLPESIGDGFTITEGPNKGKLQKDGLRNMRFQGTMLGGGISYGYHYIISNRFSLDFSLGLGYVSLNYDKYAAIDGVEKNVINGIDANLVKKTQMDYFGPTKIGITAVYILK